ncbi:IS3 family transposase, partial [Undibacterium crateris]
VTSGRKFPGRSLAYYNHESIKLKLKRLSPVQYRNQPFST